MAQAGRAGVNAVQGTPASGQTPGGQRAASSTTASEGKNTGTGRRDRGRGFWHHRDHPSSAPVTPRGYRSSTDWTVVYGHASTIPAFSPRQAADADSNRPQRRIDGVTPHGPGAAIGAGAS